MGAYRTDPSGADLDREARRYGEIEGYLSSEGLDDLTNRVGLQLITVSGIDRLSDVAVWSQRQPWRG